MIYCVEDDAGIRDIEVYALKLTGIESIGFCDEKKFFDAIQKELPELIILDIMLSGEKGIEILKRLKETSATKDIPVIIATAKCGEYDKITCLDLGADDYLVKPFGMMEMVSRIRAVLRRSKPKSITHILSNGNLVMDLDKHTVIANGECVVLTMKEFNILRSMMEKPCVVFTRDQIFTEIWGTIYNGETRTVDVHMRTLRHKLGECGNLIKTIRGLGYRMELTF
ncbi:MAG: winged helix-turn-helix domain-containing protein [Eubacteriales bacterium]